MERILILDFGAQYTQLIGGRPRYADGPEMAGLDFPVLQCRLARAAPRARQERSAGSKFWLSDCSVAAARRVPQHELSALQQKVRQYRDEFLEKWHAHFG